MYTMSGYRGRPHTMSGYGGGVVRGGGELLGGGGSCPGGGGSYTVTPVQRGPEPMSQFYILLTSVTASDGGRH